MKLIRNQLQRQIDSGYLNKDSRRFFRGLRSRISLTLGAMMIIASIGLALGLAAYAKSAFLTIAADNVETLGQQMARELSSGMSRFAREVQLQAANPNLASPNVHKDRLRKSLEEIFRIYPEFAYLSIVDATSGRVISATQGIFENGDLNGRPVFEEG
jgi:hypothetical protein